MALRRKIVLVSIFLFYLLVLFGVRSVCYRTIASMKLWFVIVTVAYGISSVKGKKLCVKHMK